MCDPWYTFFVLTSAALLPGADIPYNPVVLSYALVTESAVSWYAHAPPICRTALCTRVSHADYTAHTLEN
eukprot:2786942-Rhodomonas_salina.1